MRLGGFRITPAVSAPGEDRAFVIPKNISPSSTLEARKAE